MSSDPLVPKDPSLEPLPVEPLPFESESAPSGSALEPALEPVPETKDTKDTKPHVTPPDAAGRFTRAGALWTALVIGFLVLILLLVFIMQNMATTTVHLFGWAWELPVGIALLGGAIAGGLLTFLVGTARMLQLRRAAKKNLKAGL